MSCLVSSIACSWSGVSVNGNAFSISICQGASFENANPCVASRAAYSRRSSFAISSAAFFALRLVASHSRPPSVESPGGVPPT